MADGADAPGLPSDGVADETRMLDAGDEVSVAESHRSGAEQDGAVVA